MKIISKKYILLITCLYLTEFSGFAFFVESFTSILRKQGVGLQYLGLLYMLMLAVTFRFLWARLVDKIRIYKKGHYKGWLFLTQILMILTMIGIGFCTIEENLALIIVLITIFAFIAATQYIALDGFIYKTLTYNQRSVGNSIKMAGGLLGAIIGGGLGLILYTKIGWQNTLFVFIGFAVFSMILLFTHDEKEIQNAENVPLIGIKDIIKYYLVKERRIWLYLVATSPISVSIFFGLNAKILVDNHWELDKIGIIVNVIGYGVGTGISFLTPFFIKIFGKKNVLYAGLLGQTIGLALLIFVLNGYDSTLFVGFMAVLTYAFYPLMGIVISTLMMDNIKSSTPAFEYSIQQSVYAFSGMFFAGFSLFLAGFIGYENVIYIGVATGLLSLIAAKKMQML